MEKKTKMIITAYPAWDFQSELDALNKKSAQGWQAVHAGCFRTKLEYNPKIRYRYQVDFRKIDNLARYIETFREQGWEYVNSTFNGWHFFRKIYDPTLPEESYEIYTDKTSLKEMTGRWMKLATAIGIAVGLIDAFCIYQLIVTPNLFRLICVLIYTFESAFLLCGSNLMKKGNGSVNGKTSHRIFPALLLIVLLGCFGIFLAGDASPSIHTMQSAAGVTNSAVDDRWLDFDIKYKDNYYMDLKIKADKPYTFQIINEQGEIVFEQITTDFEEENIQLKLPKGHYECSESYDSAFSMECSID